MNGESLIAIRLTLSKQVSKGRERTFWRLPLTVTKRRWMKIWRRCRWQAKNSLEARVATTSHPKRNVRHSTIMLCSSRSPSCTAMTRCTSLMLCLTRWLIWQRRFYWKNNRYRPLRTKTRRSNPTRAILHLSRSHKVNPRKLKPLREVLPSGRRMGSRSKSLQRVSFTKEKSLPGVSSGFQYTQSQ